MCVYHVHLKKRFTREVCVVSAVQVKERFDRELCVVVTNLNQMSTEYCHPKTTPDMAVRMAVRMSMAIPGESAVQRACTVTVSAPFHGTQLDWVRSWQLMAIAGELTYSVGRSRHV